MASSKLVLVVKAVQTLLFCSCIPKLAIVQLFYKYAGANNSFLWGFFGSRNRGMPIPFLINMLTSVKGSPFYFYVQSSNSFIKAVEKLAVYLMIDKILSSHMGKPTICIGENKGSDQLRSNCKADQHLCFRNMDSTIPLPYKSKISSF